MRHETFRQEYVKCGRNCKSCPHGPYWYAYWSDKGRTRKRYVGKTMESDYEKQEQRPNREDAGHRFDDIFSKRTATRKLAWEILGLGHHATMAEIKKKYRELARKYHPDAGGDQKWMQWIAAAWSYLNASQIA